MSFQTIIDQTESGQKYPYILLTIIVDGTEYRFCNNTQEMRTQNPERIFTPMAFTAPLIGSPEEGFSQCKIAFSNVEDEENNLGEIVFEHADEMLGSNVKHEIVFLTDTQPENVDYVVVDDVEILSTLEILSISQDAMTINISAGYYNLTDKACFTLIYDGYTAPGLT